MSQPLTAASRLHWCEAHYEQMLKNVRSTIQTFFHINALMQTAILKYLLNVILQ